MGWYDLFARFYDRSLEPLYEEQRRPDATPDLDTVRDQRWFGTLIVA